MTRISANRLSCCASPCAKPRSDPGVPVLLAAPPSPVQEALPRDRNAARSMQPLCSRERRERLPPRPCAEHLTRVAPITYISGFSHPRTLPRPAALAPKLAGQDDDLTAAAAGFAPGRAAARAAIRHHRRDHAAGLVRRR